MAIRKFGGRTEYVEYRGLTAMERERIARRHLKEVDVYEVESYIQEDGYARYKRGERKTMEELYWRKMYQ